MQNGQHNTDGAHSAPRSHDANGNARGPKPGGAQALKDRINRQIDREIQACRKRLGEKAWQEHGEWVTENIIAAAKIWLARALKEGRL